MDPVTGLSRRQLIALALLIPIGVIASTFATIVSERASASCPDKTNGCVVLEPGEPVVITLLDADPATRWPFEDVTSSSINLSGATRSSRIEVARPGCSVESASEVVREAASDPPDEPSTVLVIAAACEEAAVPIVQILSDDGIPIVLLNPVEPIPTDPGYAFVAPQLDLEGQGVGVQGVGLASHLREVLAGYVQDIVDRSLEGIERVATSDGDDVLVPRRTLRDALLVEGFERA